MMLRFLLMAAACAAAMSFGQAAVAAEKRAYSIKTGNKLLEICTAKNDLWQIECAGYIEGVADEMEVLRSLHNLPQCIPNEATVGQLIDIATRYLREHPESRHMSGADLVASGFMEAWCPVPKPNP